MDILADEKQRDIAVILCGYKEPMKQLIELNPGLESRFPNRFDFKDFSFDELLTISRIRLQEYGYHFSRSAMMKYSQLLAEAYASRDPETWGNARFVANLLDHIYLRHASRCISMKEPSSKHILCITPADIEPIAVALPRRRIGFGV
jgi:stage V sporulation protein K